ncbi:TIM barrel protein [Candidatus Micrarchaeota archaeon]|nr:TIM barrel protein [Candidatus Micrarchaeota archaeon]
MLVRFGPAGIPMQCKGTSTLDGVQCCAELGLKAMEMSFVRGVRMRDEMAAEIKKTATKLDISLSSHAPYFINLCSSEEKTVKNSLRHIYEASRATFLAGGSITAIHPGFYQGKSKEDAYNLAKKRFQEVAQQLRQEKIKCYLGAENVGKKSQFGGFEEILKLANEIDMIKPVIDCSHLVARGDFPLKNENDYRKLFAILEKELGDYVRHFHFQFQEVEYSEKGERNHVALGTNNDPPYKPLMKVIAENSYAGTIISESPWPDVDAKIMQEEYNKFNS